MGNTGSSFCIRKNPNEHLRELLDMECLKSLQFNDLYFAIPSFYKMNGQNTNAKSGAITDAVNTTKQNEVEIRQCLQCKRIVVKEIEPKVLNYVRKHVRDILNSESGNTFVKNEIVPIGDTYESVNDTEVTGGSVSASAISDAALVFPHHGVDMKGFMIFFRSFIHRYRLVPDEVAVKWALSDYSKLSDELKMEYNQMKICGCHARKRVENARSLSSYRVGKQNQNCKTKSVAKLVPPRNMDYKVVARSLFTLRNGYTKPANNITMKEQSALEPTEKISRNLN